MTEVVYKVVRNCGGRLVSIVADGIWAVEYGRGVRSTGPYGLPLLAFRTLRDAYDFVGNTKTDIDEIWEAEAEVLFGINFLLDGLILIEPKEIVSFWNEARSKRRFGINVIGGILEKWMLSRYPLIRTPHGTVACKWIELKRKVV